MNRGNSQTGSTKMVERLMKEWEERDKSLKIRVKKLDDEAVVPTYAHMGDGGMDLTAVSVKNEENFIEYGTGLAMEIPYGFVGLIFPRSSVSKMDLSLANSVGMIDHQYRGEILLRFKSTAKPSLPLIPTTDGGLDTFVQEENKEYQVGDRIGQIMIVPRPPIVFVEVPELSDSDRGAGGFGSTGQ